VLKTDTELVKIMQKDKQGRDLYKSLRTTMSDDIIAKLMRETAIDVLNDRATGFITESGIRYEYFGEKGGDMK
jgi:hypothetical protein